MSDDVETRSIPFSENSNLPKDNTINCGEVEEFLK